MERDFAGVRLSEDGHRRLAALCKDDAKFPADYKSWLELVKNGTRDALADGRVVQEVSIDVERFTDWCTRVDVQPGFDSMRAYLIITRRGAASFGGHDIRDSAARESSPAPAPRHGGNENAKRAWMKGLALARDMLLLPAPTPCFAPA